MVSKIATLVTMVMVTKLVTSNVLVYQAPAVEASTCGGNCPSGTCTSCVCGSVPELVDVVTMCANFTGWSQQCCQCIVEHESGANAHAINQNADGSVDVGLWQINSGNWHLCNHGKPPCDLLQNLQCAKDVYHWGDRTWRLWSTCGLCNCCEASGELPNAFDLEI